jgi:hypothetical protein
MNKIGNHHKLENAKLNRYKQGKNNYLSGNTDLIFYQNPRSCSLPKPAVILYHFIPNEKKYLHIVLLIRLCWICF